MISVSRLCAPVESGRVIYGGQCTHRLFGAADGQWEIAAFGNNLFEEEYRVYAFDSSLFAGVVAGVYGKPLTYGLTVSWRFGAAYN